MVKYSSYGEIKIQGKFNKNEMPSLQEDKLLYPQEENS